MVSSSSFKQASNQNVHGMMNLFQRIIRLIVLVSVSWGADTHNPAVGWKPPSREAEVPGILLSHNPPPPLSSTLGLRGGGSFIPAGYNPFGYKITALGEEFLSMDGSMDCDLGRFLSSLKTKRKTLKALKQNWIQAVKVAKTAQAMRICRKLEEYLAFSLAANLID